MKKQCAAPKALLLSAYDAQSHAYWRNQLTTGLKQWQWTQLCLAPRYFSWRQRGNSLSWAFNERETLQQDYQFLLATSMVDLSALRGFVPELAQLPTILYFHENQFAYPKSAKQHSLVEPQLTSIYSALCADRLIFNSQYNQQSFLNGAKKLLKAMPDNVPKGLLERLRSKSELIPVPIAAAKVSDKAVYAGPGALRILWNHRWEYDKGPNRLLALIQSLQHMLLALPAQKRPSIEWYIVGQSFRQVPSEFEQIHKLLSAHDSPMKLVAWGYQECLEDYHALLTKADIVLSTAEHDFQGLAVLEACSYGCLPLLPDRLVYPEWFAKNACYQSGSIELEASGLAARVLDMALSRAAGQPLEEVQAKLDFSWPNLGPKYLHCIRKLLEGRQAP
ncbi:DUF3524 domain-containing protein [uncultured Pseudoteredinibacter sp.]|uniref:tRNA-queuosine alpha-mannosyltransferase domain-containing protein n=1 Tax=uncultured Pseudoteredinibacter sp. TaxID=1641701 RepID=UPI002635734C|nr:DUF3524 domain-containing protein [uncultured Pseudoteredinibacter sp.]